MNAASSFLIRRVIFVLPSSTSSLIMCFSMKSAIAFSIVSLGNASDTIESSVSFLSTLSVSLNFDSSKVTNMDVDSGVSSLSMLSYPLIDCELLTLCGRDGSFCADAFFGPLLSLRVIFLYFLYFLYSRSNCFLDISPFLISALLLQQPPCYLQILMLYPCLLSLNGRDVHALRADGVISFV